MILYRETIPFGKLYHGLMLGEILLLAAGLIIFWLNGLGAAAIAFGATILFVGWAFLGCRKTDIAVTQGYFEVRYWFMRLTISLKEILSVKVRDKIVLPHPYQGHIKVGYGGHSLPGLKVVVCRMGLPVLEMNTQDGNTVIVTPLHADKLAQVLNQKIGGKGL